MDRRRHHETDSSAVWGPDARPHRPVGDERRVADRVQDLYPSCPDGVIRAAILWPAVRHGAVRVGDLTRGGPGERMVQTLETLERQPHDTDVTYYARVRANPWALMVAHAEIVEAGDPERLRSLDPDHREQEIARIGLARRELGLDD